MIVEYQDDKGKPIEKSQLTIDNVGKPYKTKKRTIDGYKLKEVKGNESGKYVNGITKVTYIYQKISLQDELGQIVIRYVDEKDNTLAQTEYRTGKIGENYETVAKEIKGWKIKTIPKNANGKFLDTEQIITFVYTQEALEGKDGNKNDTHSDSNSGEIQNRSVQQTRDKTLPKAGESKCLSTVFAVLGFLIIIFCSKAHIKWRKIK